MKGYSFRSLTDLVLKIFKTKVNAGTGLSGGGSLEADRTLTVNYGTTAGTATQGNDSRVVNAANNATVNAKEAALEAKKADKSITIIAGTGLTGGGTLAANRTLSVSYGTATGTAAQGNDGRLSNSREWTAETISQAEAEAGVATTRRAFTAQRVRQTIVAWFIGISGALGRTILTRTTAAQVRGDLGLGTAATKDVGEDAGQVMEVGAFGLGGSTDGGMAQDWAALGVDGVSAFISSSTNGPMGSNIVQGVKIRSGSGVATSFAGRNGRFFAQTANLPWYELHHTNNLLQSTGTSTDFPMSQKATTDLLATKANTSTQVIAGTGLTGGGNLSANRTLNVSYGTAAGTAAQGNDSRITEALQKSQVQQTIGTSTSNLMSQKAVTDLFANMQPSITGSCVSNGTTNNTLVLTGIVPALALEVGDVIQITGSTDKLNDKLFTVETITDNNSIIVNYEHAGNRGNGSLRLANQTATVTIKRIAKWYNAPIGLGQGWVLLITDRVGLTTYINTTKRTIQVAVVIHERNIFYVDDVIVGQGDSLTGPDYYTYNPVVPNGSSYRLNRADAIIVWSELR